MTAWQRNITVPFGIHTHTRAHMLARTPTHRSGIRNVHSHKGTKLIIITHRHTITQT